MARRKHPKNTSAPESALQLPLPLLSDALDECQRLRSELATLRSGYEAIQRENARLREENETLMSGNKRQPVANLTNLKVAERSQSAYQIQTRSDKQKLIRGLFYGRQDVYADLNRRQQTGSGVCPESTIIFPHAQKLLP